MAITEVGVRDLKADAPRLVERAARGEHIVITRYGRPRAQLGPVTATPGSDAKPSARMAEWQAQRAAFARLLPRLLRRLRGRYVAIRDGRVIASDADHDRLFERVWPRLGGRACFIGRVGGPPPLVEMPGFETA
ncbi:MAG TPA: type II toxin-antitoxin system prevent-host-death family antitoxin [Polyangia bacterium]|jgi:prevent-host-death family protein